MYSRYQRIPYDPYDEEDATDESSDEYELYRYNLPPKYDGSRFGRNSASKRKNTNVRETHMDSRAACSSNEEDTSEQCANKGNDTLPVCNTSHIAANGYEDLLIICLILLISEKSEGTSDTILLLILLLGAK